MAGLLDFLGPAVNAATADVTAVGQGQDALAKAKQQQVIQTIQLQQQQRETAIHNALMQAQTGEANARTGDLADQGQLRQYQLTHPKPNYSAPVIGPHGEVQLIDQNDPIHPIQVPGIQGKVEREPQSPVARYSAQVITAPDGSQHIARFNNLTGQIEDTGTTAKTAPAKPSLQVQRVQQHYQPAADADALLDKYGNALPASAGRGTITNFLTGAVDPNMQQATQAANEFITHVGPLVNNGRMTKVDLDQIRHTYVPEVGDTPQLVQQKSQRRKALLQSLHAETTPNSGPPSATPPTPSTGSQAQQLWDAAVQKYGRDKVIQEVGQRPTE